MEHLSELFKESRGKPVDFRGQTVQMMFDLEFQTQEMKLEIQLKTTGQHPQGLRIRCPGGKLRVNDAISSDLVIWADSAPALVTVTVLSANSSTRPFIRFWNVWRDSQGVTQAWIGNSGMVVEVAGDHIHLLCSDGFDGAHFGDLGVDIRIVRHRD